MKTKKGTASLHTIGSPVTEFEKICAMFQSLLQSEYQRGSQDAAQRILGLVGAANKSNPVLSFPALPAPKRVPRGAAKVFVEKCLRSGPAKISEISGRAQTPIERKLSYQTIRLELLRGVKEKRYQKKERRYSLAD